jgi:SNF2 family DNA or RNA helicase
MASAKALQKEYDKYLLTAKKYDLDGDLRRAKAYFQRALQLVPKFKKSKTNEKNAEKLKKKIAKYVQKIMEEDIQKQMSGFGVSRPSSSQTSEENDENATQANVSKKDGEGKSKGLKDVPSSEWSIPDENGNSAYLPEGYSITKTLYDTLFEHQRKGVSWLWDLYRDCRGGVLADDMGLGKTIQVIAFISGLLRQRKKRRVLIVAPASLIPHWRNEIKRFDPTIAVGTFSTQSKKKRNAELRQVIKRGGVLVTNYEKIWHSARSSNADLFNCSTSEACEEMGWKQGKTLQWAAVVLDEGHRIKNHNTGIYSALSSIASRMKLVLSGTPIQNNLNELWSIFSFISDGTMFPSLTLFRRHIAAPIEEGETLDATKSMRKEARYKRKQLHLKIQKFFLRREKGKTIPKPKGQSSEKVQADSDAKQAEIRKHDMVVWIPLSTTQQDVYTQVLESSRVVDILRAVENEEKIHGGSVLLAMNDLKQVCDGRKTSVETDPDARAGARSSQPVQEDYSCKLVFLKNLLTHFKASDHRTLIFSKFTKCLDAIELMCVRSGIEAGRIDGAVKHEERQDIVDKFNHSTDLDCMLLTTGVGAVGLTLTGADRVVIFGPDWNPAIDNQAVDRAFRIGQFRDVICYRLMTCNTIEEIMYRRQVFKDGLVRSVLQDKAMNVYSSEQDLSELFAFTDPNRSDMQEYLAEEQREQNQHFKEHYSQLVPEMKAVRSMNVYGITHHGTLFDEERNDTDLNVPEEGEDEEKIAAIEARRKETASMGLTTEADGSKGNAGDKKSANDERRRARRNKKMAKKALKHLDTMRDDLFETWSSFSEMAMGNFEESMKVHDEARERYVDSPENYGEWVKSLNEETIEKLDEIIDLFQEHCGEVFEECFDGLINICRDAEGFIPSLLHIPDINLKSFLIWEENNAFKFLMDGKTPACPIPSMFPAIDHLIEELQLHAHKSRKITELRPKNVEVTLISQSAGIKLKSDQTLGDGVYFQKLFDGEKFQRKFSRNFEKGYVYQLIKVGSDDVRDNSLNEVCEFITSASRPLKMVFSEIGKASQLEEVDDYEEDEQQDSLPVPSLIDDEADEAFVADDYEDEEEETPASFVEQHGTFAPPPKSLDNNSAYDTYVTQEAQEQEQEQEQTLVEEYKNSYTDDEQFPQQEELFVNHHEENLEEESNSDFDYDTAEDKVPDGKEQEKQPADSTPLLHGFLVTTKLAELSPEDREKYDSFFEAAAAMERDGKDVEALSLYIEALNISDEQFELHQKVFVLADRNGMVDMIQNGPSL